MSDFHDSTTARGVVVTGGGTGIGRATARAFAAAGDRVLVVGRTESTLEEAADGHPGIRVLAVDIAGRDAPERIVDAARREFGRIDILVNNAARPGFDPMGKLDRATVEAQVATNLLAPVFLTQQALDSLEATRGTVINVGSAGAIGLRAMPTSSVYAATKVAVDSLTRTWAVELGARGIRVVSLAPGLVNTGVGVRAGMPPQAYDAFLAQMAPQVPAGRIGTPEEIAWWIVQLARPEAAYVNGALLAVDGGLSLT